MHVYVTLLALLAYVGGVTHSSGVLYWKSSLVDSLPSGKNNVCGCNDATKEVTIFTSGEYYVYDTIAGTVQHQSLDDAPNIYYQGQCYTQIGDAIYFLFNNTLGIFNVGTSSLSWPASDVSFSQFGREACMAAFARLTVVLELIGSGYTTWRTTCRSQAHPC